jgi:hypothetical protein
MKITDIITENQQSVQEGTDDFSRNVEAFRVYQHLDPMEFYKFASTPQGLKTLAQKAGTTPESVKDSLERLDWGQFPDEFYHDDEEQGITEASGNAAKMARVAKMCARQAFKDTDRPDSKMFLKAAEYFAAGDEKKGLATIARMDTEARDDFHMGCEDAGIPIPEPEPGFLDSLPAMKLTPAQEKKRKAMVKGFDKMFGFDKGSTK